MGAYKGAGMTEEQRAELYTSPGGKFIRADSLPRILAHWRSMRSPQRLTHFIKELSLNFGDGGAGQAAAVVG